MSKIKTSNVTPRTTGGSLTIGEPRSTTYFHKDSDVVIPGYATKDYVDEVASAAPHGNPVFHLNDNKLVRSYTIPEGKNAGTFGELEMDDNVDVHVPDGSTWTIVGNKEVGSDGTIALSDLVDTDIPMIPQPDAMLWYDEFSGKWKPKTISSLPQGEAGQDGEDGKSAYEIYAETTSDSPVKTVQEWLDSLQGADGEDGKDSLEVWLEKNPGSTEEDYWESMRGPIGPDGLSSFDLWLADNPGGTEEEYWASLEGPQGQPGPGFDYKGNVATEADLPNDSGNPNSDGDAYFVEDVGEIFAWGADDQWHSLGQIQGPQGDEGDKGETGDSAYEIWLKSNPGKTEQEFLDSLKGEQGETGEDGEDGLGQMVGVGSTVTLDAGESATVTQNPNLSTQEKIILDFGIPKGLDGIDGLPGDEGLPGADGASAYESWLAAGNSGSEQDFLDSIVGDKGDDGEDGLSAYEVAIENGFSGTEEEWLNSLVGEKGPQGDGIHVKGHVSDESQLPPTAEVGDAYGDDNGDLWVYSDSGTWINFGRVQGPAGEDGKDGKSAYASALDAGFQGSEEEWIASLKGDEGEPGESIKGDPGDDGKSAYDIAVEQGFQGTEDQWLESLKGEDGLLDDETLAQIQDDLTQINSTLTPSSDGTVLTGHVTDNGDGTFTHTTSWEEVEHPDPGYTGGDLHVDGTFSAAHEGAGDAAIAIGQKGMYEGEGPAGEINQGWSAIAIGAGAGWKDQGDGGVAVGAVAAEISQGANGIAIGGGAGYNSQGEASISVGLNSGNGYQGRDSVSIGSNSGCKSQGARSVAVGKSAGYENQGQESIAIGSGAGLRSQPDNSIAIGKDSAPAAENSIQLKAGTTTFDVTPTEVLHNGQPIGGGGGDFDNSHTDDTNVQVGEGALSKYTSDTYRYLMYNTVVGKDAFTDSYGQGNTAVGTRAGVSATGGSFNVGVGAEALEWTTTGSNNTALGAYALSHNPEGSYNVCIGYSNSFTLESGDNNIVIGALADPSGENVSNEITLGSGYNDKFRVPGVGLEITKDEVLHNGQPIGGGGGGGLQSIQYIHSSGTWTKPSGVTKVRVYVTGGGGSGATRSGSNHNSGGWGGGTAIKFIDVSSISSATVTVGSGGPANTTAKAGGQDGGDSVWDDGTNVLTGGGGKGEGSWSSSASGGDMNIPGSSYAGYIGGASFWANQSHASHNFSSSLHTYASSSNNTSVAGLGQGGRAYYSSGVTGYAGGNGIIVVEEYA